MADGTVTRVRARLPAAARIAIVYLAARLVTAGFLLVAAELSGPESRFGPDATLATLSMGWDALWYWQVVLSGYPTELPVGESGVVQQNLWAFLPLYPWVSNAVGTVVGSYALGAVIVSLVSGYLACLALHALLRARLDESATMWAVTLFAAGPLAVMFQMGYAEALFLLLLFLALRCVSQRRYAWLYLLIPLMGYTRPGVLAFSLFLALHGCWRWLRRRAEPLGVRETVHIVATGILAAVVGFSWQVIAAVVTGEPSAYLDTELAWRRGWIGEESGFVPFDGFIRASALWFRLWGLPEALGYIALAACVVVVAAVLLFDPRVRRLGMEVRLWSASYLVYLLAVFFPQTSIFRLLLPLSPLYGALAAPPRPAWRWSMLVLGLVGQWWWIYNMLALGSTYYQVP